MTLNLATAPFALHVIVASFAGITFILRPSAQLSPLTESAKLILQSYGGLILFTNLMALIFYARPFDDSSRLAAFAFAFWHVWPSYRAIERLRRGIDTKGEMGRTLGGPGVHLISHAVLFTMFVGSAMLSP